MFTEITTMVGPFPTKVGPVGPLYNIAALDASTDLRVENNFPSNGSNGLAHRLALEVTINDHIAPADITFFTKNSNGAALYVTSVVVPNAAALALPGYQFVLGRGVGSAFTPLTNNDSASFEGLTPPATSNLFANINITPNVATYSGGSIDPQTLGIMTFNIVLRDGPTTPSSFTLRQVAIPEPASLTFLLGGPIVMLQRQRKAR